MCSGVAITPLKRFLGMSETPISPAPPPFNMPRSRNKILFSPATLYEKILNLNIWFSMTFHFCPTQRHEANISFNKFVKINKERRILNGGENHFRYYEERGRTNNASDLDSCHSTKQSWLDPDHFLDIWIYITLTDSEPDPFYKKNRQWIQILVMFQGLDPDMDVRFEYLRI